MSWLLQLFIVFIALSIIIEAFNKLERTDLSRRRLRAACWPERLAIVLRALGWLCLLLAGGGAPFADQLPRWYVELGYFLAVFGSFCLVARARLEEGFRCTAPDAFERTQVLSRP